MTKRVVPERWIFAICVAAALAVPHATAAGQRKNDRSPNGRVFKMTITPHWFADNTRFWYRNDLRDGMREFVAVDAVKGIRAPAFDHDRLAKALTKAGVMDISAERLPIDPMEFDTANNTFTFSAHDSTWSCDLATYETKKIDKPAATGENRNGSSRAANPSQPAGDKDALVTSHQDGKDSAPKAPTSRDKWTYAVKDHNIFLQAKEGGEEIQLSHDGTKDQSYEMLQWAPDGMMLVAFRCTPGEPKEVYRIESSPAGGGRAKLLTSSYPLPGDKFPCYELNVFNPQTKHQLKPDVGIIDFGAVHLRWSTDGRRFIFPKMDRGHQRFRLIRVDTHTGDVQHIIDEKTDTFIWTAHAESVKVPQLAWLSQTDEIIHASERDGWRHLYLVDVKAGVISNQITKGQFVVRAVDLIDEKKRQIWFRASGMNPEQDPYLLHFYRINFDGSGLVALTDGHGQHEIQYSPDKSYLIDTYSRVDMAPVHELRRVSDGKLMCLLEKADTTELDESGWQPPEVFVAKGRDGKTDIWGIICRPVDLDPGRTYPVIEEIYAGPQSAYVPKSFSTGKRYGALNDLGFIVVKIDGMGTALRSKAFHDVCWHNLKDGGFPDRILWMKAAAGKYPYMDLTRVGVYGTSAGGQNAAGAVLFHPEFYKAAVANSGCHDNRMDKASWNEQWMGYPVGPQYAANSNIDNAHRLKGHLMLIVGELDSNVPPESTLRFADALIKANKVFDLLVIPGGGHGAGGSYGWQRIRDFFQQHLQGIAPPNRNAD